MIEFDHRILTLLNYAEVALKCDEQIHSLF